MNKIETIMEQLQTLTLLEAAELVKKIEEVFDVDASAGGGMMMMNSAVGDTSKEEIEEKTEFDLILAEVPADKKIAILKVIRTITGLGLKEAKNLVEAAPKMVQEAMSKDAVDVAKKQLEEAGAKVELK
jgi:large subunit ribosomal protein L7/L12